MMPNPRLRQLLHLSVLLPILAVPALAQRDFSGVEIKTVKVTDGVYMLIGAGGNLGVSVGADGVFLIDDQYAPLTPKIKAAVAAITDQPINFVLNTHYHGDHTGGNENLGKGGTLIVGHDNVRRRLLDGGTVEFFQMVSPPAPDAALPVVTYAQGVHFHVNGDDLEAVHMPDAHTDGDSVVIFHQANVVHMGDLFFNGMYPFIDVGAGGSIGGVIAGIEWVIAHVDDATKIIPGHGELSNRAELTEYVAMLKHVRDTVAGHLEAGKSRQEIVESKPLAPFEERYGGGFIKAEHLVGFAIDSMK